MEPIDSRKRKRAIEEIAILDTYKCTREAQEPAPMPQRHLPAINFAIDEHRQSLGSYSKHYSMHSNTNITTTSAGFKMLSKLQSSPEHKKGIKQDLFAMIQLGLPSMPQM